MKKPQPIPFDFVLEHLFSLDPRVRPMFGCHAIYVGDKIMLIVRHKADHVDDNGIWMATKTEHHAALKQLFPSMRSINVLGNGEPTNWQILPEKANDFEESGLAVCDLILKGDSRIGNVPKTKKKKKISPSR